MWQAPRRRHRRRYCRYLGLFGFVRLVRCCPRPPLGEGPGILLLVGRVRLSTALILILTSLIVSRSTRKVVGCVVVVRAVVARRLKKCRRKPRGRGCAVATMELLLPPD